MTGRGNLTLILVATMLIALFMGCGPGIYLINPDSGDPNATRFIMGLPVIWLWVVFWFLVEGACIVVAATFLWKEDSP